MLWNAAKQRVTRGALLLQGERCSKPSGIVAHPCPQWHIRTNSPSAPRPRFHI